MPESIIGQVEYEISTWKRLLTFIMDENIHVKQRFAEILKYVSERNLLDEMEEFNNKFVKIDELVKLLRNDIAQLDKEREYQITTDGKTLHDIDRKLKKVRNNMINAESEFNKVSIQFNSCVYQMLNNNWKKSGSVPAG